MLRRHGSRYLPILGKNIWSNIPKIFALLLLAHPAWPSLRSCCPTSPTPRPGRKNQARPMHERPVSAFFPLPYPKNIRYFAEKKENNLAFVPERHRNSALVFITRENEIIPEWRGGWENNELRPPGPQERNSCIHPARDQRISPRRASTSWPSPLRGTGTIFLCPVPRESRISPLVGGPGGIISPGGVRGNAPAAGGMLVTEPGGRYPVRNCLPQPALRANECRVRATACWQQRKAPGSTDR